VRRPDRVNVAKNNKHS